MVVPVQEVKNKELLIEVDSIVTDNKDLANVSLSSNDSLSKSRRKWRLIRIINKLNPALAERKYQFPSCFKFFVVWFLIILSTMFIYWLLAPRSVVNSHPDCPSSVKSSPPQPVSPSPTPQVSPRIPIKLSPLEASQFPLLQILSSKPSIKKQEDSEISIPVIPSHSIPYEKNYDLSTLPPYHPTSDIELDPNDEEEVVAYYPADTDFMNVFEDSEDSNLFDYPDDYYPFSLALADSSADLSDTFDLRSSGVNSDLLLKSVDKFINFFKSMINF